MVSYSARPGMISSKDDFYQLGSGLVVIETTSNIYNKALFEEYLNPKSVLTWMRTIIANRMATNVSCITLQTIVLDVLT